MEDRKLYEVYTAEIIGRSRQKSPFLSSYVGELDGGTGKRKGFVGLLQQCLSQHPLEQKGLAPHTAQYI